MSFAGVNPGKYRHRVSIQVPTHSPDSETGALALSWATVSYGGSSGALYDVDGNPLTFVGGTPIETVGDEALISLSAVPAEVLTGPGRELHAAGTKLAETTARIAMRWFEGLREDMRILWDGKVYDIISIETDATARREYRLRCKDGLSDGN